MCVQAFEQLQYICTHKLLKAQRDSCIDYPSASIYAFLCCLMIQSPGSVLSLVLGLMGQSSLLHRPHTTRFPLKVNRLQNPLTNNVFSRVFPVKFSRKPVWNTSTNESNSQSPMPQAAAAQDRTSHSETLYEFLVWAPIFEWWMERLIMHFTDNLNINTMERSRLDSIVLPKCQQAGKSTRKH